MKVNRFWTTKDLHVRKNLVHNLNLSPYPWEAPTVLYVRISAATS